MNNPIPTFEKQMDKIKKKKEPYLEDNRYCSNCGSEAEIEPGGDENEPPYLFCPKCDKTLKQPARCPKCGEEVRADDDGLCGNCI